MIETFLRMEDIKLVKKITDWNPIGVRTKGQPKNRWRDEAINDLKKLKLTNWVRLSKERKAWNDLVQKIETHIGL
jgi:hypothetical protein